MVEEPGKSDGVEEDSKEGTESDVAARAWTTESVSMISVSLLLVAFGVGVITERCRHQPSSKASSALQKEERQHSHKLLQPPQSSDYNAPVPSATHMDPPSLGRSMGTSLADAPVRTGFLKR